MTNPQNPDPTSADSSADSNGYHQDRTRFRVEVSPDTHQTLRETASREGKYMKVLLEEILQAYFGQQGGNYASGEQDEPAQQN